MKGRQDDWQGHLTALPAALAVPAIAAAGFEGLYVDRAGYADSGNDLDAFMREEIGATGLESRDGRLLFRAWDGS